MSEVEGPALLIQFLLPATPCTQGGCGVHDSGALPLGLTLALSLRNCATGQLNLTFLDLSFLFC